MQKNTSKNILQICKKGLRYSLKSIAFIVNVWASTKEKEHKPTDYEIMCGEQIPFSDEYHILNEKYKKR